MLLRPKHWDKFQHYKDRRPPWIKLHRDLLDNFDYARLPVASKAIAPLLWLLASEYQDGVIEASIEELAFRLRIDDKTVNEGVKHLIDKGFFVDDSTMLASCLHDAIPETETETEKEREKETEKETDLRKPERSAVPYSEIVDLYHQKLPMLAQVYKMTTLRKNKVKLLWHEELQSLNAWENYFDFISQSAFLTGKTIGKDGRAFIADFDFIVNQTNFVKIAEEKYHGKKV